MKEREQNAELELHTSICYSEVNNCQGGINDLNGYVSPGNTIEATNISFRNYKKTELIDEKDHHQVEDLICYADLT